MTIYALYDLKTKEIISLHDQNELYPAFFHDHTYQRSSKCGMARKARWVGDSPAWARQRQVWIAQGTGNPVKLKG